MAGVTLKRSYKCTQSVQQLYNGGPVAISSDGSFMACVCKETIKIVNYSDASIKGTLDSDGDAVTALTITPDDTFLISASHSRQIRVWDLKSLNCVRSWKIFSGSADTTVRAWNLATKKCATMKNHFSDVVSLAISEDRRFLLSAGRDKVVNVWDLLSYDCKMTIPTYEALFAVCVIRSGTPFYDGLSLNRFGKSKSMQEVNFLTAGERGVVRIWEVCLLKLKASEVAFSFDKDDYKIGFTSAHLLPSDQGLMCITADQQFLFYSPLKRSEEVPDLGLTKRLIGYNVEIIDMKFVGEDENFLAVATNIEQVHVYELPSMSCSYVLAGHSGIILCLDTCIGSSGSVYVVTGSKDKSVKLWDTKTRKCVGDGIGHQKAVGAVAFSKKQRNFFVSGSWIALPVCLGFQNWYRWPHWWVTNREFGLSSFLLLTLVS